MKHEKVVSLEHSKRVIRFAELVLGPNPVERLLPGTLEQWARLFAKHSVTDAEVESLGRWRSNYCVEGWPTPQELRESLSYLRTHGEMPAHRLQLSHAEELAIELLALLQSKGEHLVNAAEALQMAAGMAVRAHHMVTVPGLPLDAMVMQTTRSAKRTAETVEVAVDEASRGAGPLGVLEAYLFAGRELHYDMQIDLIAEQRPEGFD